MVTVAGAADARPPLRALTRSRVFQKPVCPMHLMTKTSFLLAATLIAGSATAAEPPPAASSPPSALAELFGDPVIAKGKGVEIKQSRLDKEFILYRANLTARGQDVTLSQRTLREAQLLDRLIVTQLVNEIGRASCRERV